MKSFVVGIVIAAATFADAEKCSGYGPCKNINMLSRLGVEDLGWPTGTLCTSSWGWIDDRTAKKYAILSCEPGHTLIDVTDPYKPKAVGNLKGEAGGKFRWRDVKVYKNFAFMVSDALMSKVQILDLQAAVDGRATSTYTLPPDNTPAGTTEGQTDVVNFPRGPGAAGAAGNAASDQVPAPAPSSEDEDVLTTEDDEAVEEYESYEYENVEETENDDEETENDDEETENDDEETENRRRSLRGLKAKKKNNRALGKKKAKVKNVPQFKATTIYTGNSIFQSHNIEINEDSGYAYAVGGGNNCDTGLHMIDIRDPGHPKFAGCYSNLQDLYIHDAHCRSYTREHLDGKYAGREICFAFSPKSLMILDVTNKNDVTLLSKLTYDQVGYIHQGWLTSDRSFLMIDDERDETGNGIKTFIADVRDLRNPKLAHIHHAAGEEFKDHNQYVLHIGSYDYTFQSNYAGGVRVLRILRGPVKGLGDDEVFKLEEVAYFDANPNNDDEMFGVWTAYPFWQEDRIITMADMGTGFYVVRWEIDDETPDIPYKAPTPPPTIWSNCPEIKSQDACSKAVACKWDWDWQNQIGWFPGCYYAPTGSVKPTEPWRAPPKGCSSLKQKTQCTQFPACNWESRSCRTFQLPG